MNANLIDLGFINITYYALFIVSALIIGYFIARKEALTYHQFSENNFADLIFYTVIWALIGARIWYVTFNFDLYKDNILQIFAIWNGGIAIHGSILGGAGYLLYYAKKYNRYFFELTDIAVPSLILGQAIGRWGNFFNQEAHGGPTTKEFLSETLHLPNFIVEGMNIDGIYYQPTFLYESLFNLLGFILIITLIRPKTRKQYGIITGFYLIWYGIIRSIIEVMRTDALYFGDFKIARVTSFVFIIGGLILIIYTIYRKRKKEKKEKK